MKKLSTVLMLLAAAFIGRALQASSLIGGTVIYGDNPYSKIIVGVDSDSQQHCSGVLIAPEWVLTAAHCAAQDDDLSNEQMFSLLDVTTPDGYHDSGKVTVFPGYHYLPASRGAPGDRLVHDLALIHLRRPSHSSLPLKLDSNPKPIDFLNSTGARVVALGWSDQEGRPAYKVIHGPYTTYNLFTDPLSATLRISGSVTGHGDSGGAVIIDQNGQFTLVGIFSRACVEKSGQAGCSLAELVSSHLDWIRQLTQIN